MQSSNTCVLEQSCMECSTARNVFILKNFIETCYQLGGIVIETSKVVIIPGGKKQVVYAGNRIHY